MNTTGQRGGGIAQSLSVRAAVADRIAGGKLDIPLLHDVALQVLSVSSAGEVDSKRLVDLILRDQALAMHVLRIANSAAYQPREPIVSLQHAIARLGLTTLRNIVIAVSVRTRLFSFGAFEGYARALWRHALATALYAREVARCAEVDPEFAFMSGLLHDVGKPVVLKVIADLGDSYVDMLGPTLVKQVLEEHHIEVGRRLCERWKLPVTIMQGVAFHHDWASAGDLARRAVMVIALADTLAESLTPDFTPEDAPAADPLEHPVLAPLGIFRADVAELVANKKAAFTAFLDATDF